MSKETRLALRSAVVRFVRIVVPQIPALVSFIQSSIDPATVPAFIPPLLVLFGAVATSIDKFLREIGFYSDIREYVGGKK